MLVKVIFEKPYIFQKSIFKKMPPDIPRNRIRDLSGASLLVVKGCPEFIESRTWFPLISLLYRSLLAPYVEVEVWEE